MRIWCIHCEGYEEQELIFHDWDEYWITYCPTHKEYTAHTVEYEGRPPNAN